MDAEWQPETVAAAAMNPVSLLQIATRSRIYLVDCQAVAQPGMALPASQGDTGTQSEHSGEISHSQVAEACSASCSFR